MVNKKRSRRDRILELVNEKGSITTAELSSHFQVTNETIRKDLHYLDSAGCIKKTHGGANCIGTLFRELPSLQLEQYRSEKIKIAKSAARFLKNNAVFFIDSGSTASYLATLLDSFHSITVVTTSMHVANIMQSQGTDNYLYSLVDLLITRPCIYMVVQWNVRYKIFVLLQHFLVRAESGTTMDLQFWIHRKSLISPSLQTIAKSVLLCVIIQNFLLAVLHNTFLGIKSIILLLTLVRHQRT